MPCVKSHQLPTARLKTEHTVCIQKIPSSVTFPVKGSQTAGLGRSLFPYRFTYSQNCVLVRQASPGTQRRTGTNIQMYSISKLVKTGVWFKGHSVNTSTHYLHHLATIRCCNSHVQILCPNRVYKRCRTNIFFKKISHQLFVKKMAQKVDSLKI